MTDKLSLYKGALRVLGERSISSLTEARPPRYHLDEAWDSGFLNDVLYRGLWNFAIKTIQIEYTGDINPDFGPSRAFEKPSDWLRTAALSGDEDFNQPLKNYLDEQGYWFADYDTLYVKFISNDSEYGHDLSIWPVRVVRAAEYLLAGLTASRITQSRVKEADIMQRAEDLFSDARAVDAMNQPAMFPPTGSWVRSRRSGFSNMSRYSGGWR